MDLKKYLDSRNIQQKEFADMIGVSPGSINNYISKKRMPTLPIARSIEKATKGKVTIDDLIDGDSLSVRDFQKSWKKITKQQQLKDIS